jgi:hypothetical protein
MPDQVRHDDNVDGGRKLGFWRFKLLEFAVWGATGTVLIPLIFGIGILVAQTLQPANETNFMLGLAAIWLMTSIILSNILTAKFAKRWSR